MSRTTTTLAALAVAAGLLTGCAGNPGPPPAYRDAGVPFDWQAHIDMVTGKTAATPVWEPRTLTDLMLGPPVCGPDGDRLCGEPRNTIDVPQLNGEVPHLGTGALPGPAN